MSKTDNKKKDRKKSAKGKGGKAKEPLPPATDLGDFFATRYAPNVSKSDRLLVQWAKDGGHDIHPVAEPVNAHGIAAFARDSLLCRILAKRGRGKQSLRLWDFWGAARTLGIANSVAALSACTLEVCVAGLDGRPVQGDAARQEGLPQRHREEFTTEWAVTQRWDVGVFVDIYHLTPEDLHRALQLCDCVYVMQHPLTGSLGADTYTVTISVPAEGDQKPQKQVLTRTEGTWYIDAEGYVVFFNDAEAVASYPRHPRPTWLFQRHYQGLDIDPYASMGPFTCFHVAYARVGAVPILPSEVRVGPQHVPAPGFLNSAARTLADKAPACITHVIFVAMGYHESDAWRFVDPACASAVTRRLAGRLATGSAVDTGLTIAREHLATIPGWDELSRRHPKETTRLILDSCVAGLEDSRAALAGKYLDVRERWAYSEDALARARAPNPLAPASAARWRTLARTLVGAATLLGLGALFKLYRLWLLLRSGMHSFAAIVAGATRQVFRALRQPWRYAVRRPPPGNLIHALTAPGLPCDLAHTPGSVGTAFRATVETPFGLAGWGILEECAAALLPVHLEWLLWALEAVAYAHHGSQAQAVFVLGLHGMCAAMRHLLPTPWGLLSAAAVHGAWNWRAGGVRAQWKGAWEAFRCEYAEGRQIDCVAAGVLTDAAALPAFVAPKITAPQFLDPAYKARFKWAGTEVTMQQAIELANALPAEPQLSVFPLLITNGALWQPAHHPRNFLQAHLNRVAIWPWPEEPLAWHRGELKPSWQQEVARRESDKLAWYTAVFREWSADWPRLGDLPTVQQCAEAMGGPRGKRLLAGEQRIEDGTQSERGAKYSTKLNEVIKVDSSVDPHKFTPRCIRSFEPERIARTIPSVRAATDALHLLFSPDKVWKIGTHRVRLIWASGYTQSQLCALYEVLTDPAVAAILVAGDDSLGHTGPAFPSATPYDDADAEKFDQTQRQAAVVDFGEMWQLALGFEAPVVRELIHMATCEFRAECRELQVAGVAGVQMPTGTSETTIKSSVDMLVGRCLPFLTGMPLMEAAALAGFKLKVAQHATLGGCTFLKGWWVNDTWLPLPSQVLKAGKSLTRPQLAVFAKGNPLRYDNSPQVCVRAARALAWAIASGYGDVPRDYPIMGPFLDAMQRDCPHRVTLVSGREEDYHAHKRVESIRHYDRSEALAMIEQRYGITSTEVADVESMIRISHVPGYVFHPVFRILYAKDYC